MSLIGCVKCNERSKWKNTASAASSGFQQPPRGFHSNSCDHSKRLALQCLHMAPGMFVLPLHPHYPLYLPPLRVYGITGP